MVNYFVIIDIGLIHTYNYVMRSLAFITMNNGWSVLEVARTY